MLCLKVAISHGNIGLMHEEDLGSWLREDVEGRKAEIERLNVKAKQEESTRGKMEVEREQVEIKRLCLIRVSGDFFEDFRPMTERESDGDFLGISGCVLAVSSFCDCCACCVCFSC